MTAKIRGTTDAAIKLRSFSAEDADFTVDNTPFDREVSGTVGSLVTLDDVKYNNTSGAVVNREALLKANTTEPVTFISNDPTIATVEEDGHVRVPDSYTPDPLSGNFVNLGTARIRVRTAKAAKTALVPITQTTGTTSKRFNSYVDNSVGKAMDDLINTLMVGKTYPTAFPLFSTRDHEHNIYVRNTDCWAAGLFGYTAHCVFNTNDPRKHATMISPRHFMTVSHFAIGIGHKIRWVTLDNQVVERTVVGLYPPIYENQPDWSVGYLDADIPGTIAYAKILPENFFDVYAPSATFSNSHSAFGDYGTYIPIAATDRNRNATLAACSSGGGTIPLINTAGSADNFYTNRAPFYAAGSVPGDSGSPAFFIIPNHTNPSLLEFCYCSYYGVINCSPPQNYKAAINAAMSATRAMSNNPGPDYQLVEVDLAGYAQF